MLNNSTAPLGTAAAIARLELFIPAQVAALADVRARLRKRGGHSRALARTVVRLAGIVTEARKQLSILRAA